MKTNSKPKVLVLAYSDVRFDPRIKKQCDALHRDGYQVEFYGVRYSSDEINEAFNVSLYFYRSYRNFIQYFQYFLLMVIFFFVQLCNIHKKPIIIIHNIPNFLVIPSLLFRLFGFKLILDLHDDSVLVISKVVKNKTMLALVGFIENTIALKVPNKLMTVNRLLARQARERSGKEVLLLHNAPQFIAKTCSYNYSKGNPIKLVYIGHLGTHYGLEDFLQKLCEIKEVVPLTLDIYGGGKIKKRLEKIINKHDLNDSVKLHGAFLACDVSTILKQFDLGVALYEKTELTDVILPVKIIEYTFNCLPSLTLPLNVTREYFKDNSLIYIKSLEELPKIFTDIYTGQIKLDVLHKNALGDIAQIAWDKEKLTFLDFVRSLNG